MKITGLTRHELIEKLMHPATRAEATRMADLLIEEKVADTNEVSYARWCELVGHSMFGSKPQIAGAAHTTAK